MLCGFGEEAGGVCVLARCGTATARRDGETAKRHAQSGWTSATREVANDGEGPAGSEGRGVEELGGTGREERYEGG